MLDNKKKARKKNQSHIIGRTLHVLKKNQKKNYFTSFISPAPKIIKYKKKFQFKLCPHFCSSFHFYFHYFLNYFLLKHIVDSLHLLSSVGGSLSLYLMFGYFFYESINKKKKQFSFVHHNFNFQGPMQMTRCNKSSITLQRRKGSRNQMLNQRWVWFLPEFSFIDVPFLLHRT